MSLKGVEGLKRLYMDCVPEGSRGTEEVVHGSDEGGLDPICSRDIC